MSLVSVDDVAARLGWPLTSEEQVKVQALIDDCTVLVEDWTGKDFDLRTDQSFPMVGDGSCFLKLPRRVLPYIQVSAVLVDGVEITDWVLQGQALYRELGWPCESLVVVTGSWGYLTPPAAVSVAITAEVIRWFSVAPGVAMERTGEREVQYATSPSQSLSEAAKHSLRRWHPQLGSISLRREDW